MSPAHPAEYLLYLSSPASAPGSGLAPTHPFLSHFPGTSTLFPPPASCPFTVVVPVVCMAGCVSEARKQAGLWGELIEERELVSHWTPKQELQARVLDHFGHMYQPTTFAWKKGVGSTEESFCQSSMLLEERSIFLAFVTVDLACGSVFWISEIRPFYPRPFQKHFQLIRPGVLNCRKKQQMDQRCRSFQEPVCTWKDSSHNVETVIDKRREAE